MTTATTSSLGTVKLAGDLGGNNNGLAPELIASGVTPGTYGTNPTFTVNSKGIITDATSGSAIDVFNIPIASLSTLGVVKIGTGVSILGDGTIFLPPATEFSLGVVKVGAGLEVDGSGIISVDTSVVPQLEGGFQYSGSISVTPEVNSSASGTIVLDLEVANLFELTLTGNITLAAPTNIPPGGVYYVVLKQDATGSRTCSFNAAFLFESGSSTTLTTAANAIDLLRITVSSLGLTCRLYKNFV